MLYALVILILGLLVEKLFQLIKWLISLFFKRDVDGSQNRLNWELTMAKIATIESTLDDIIVDIAAFHGEEMSMARKESILLGEMYNAHLGENAKDIDGRFKWWYPTSIITTQQELIKIMSEVLGELRAIRRQEEIDNKE